MYQLLLFVHIICAVIWVGGAVYAQLLAFRVARSPVPLELPHLARHIEFIGTRIFLPAALLLFVAGTAMTLQTWSFGQTWIAVSVALWVLSAVVGAVYLGPRVERAAEFFQAEGPTSAGGPRTPQSPVRGLAAGAHRLCGDHRSHELQAGGFETSHPAPPNPRTNIGMRSEFINANGIRFHYLTDGAGPLVILLHGFPQLSYEYRHLVPALARAGYRAAAPDCGALARRADRHGSRTTHSILSVMTSRHWSTPSASRKPMSSDTSGAVLVAAEAGCPSRTRWTA